MDIEAIIENITTGSIEELSLDVKRMLIDFTGSGEEITSYLQFDLSSEECGKLEYLFSKAGIVYFSSRNITGSDCYSSQNQPLYLASSFRNSRIFSDAKFELFYPQNYLNLDRIKSIFKKE